MPTILTPDVMRVGRDHYMVASGFNAMPGIPVLHYKDWVDWSIIDNAYDRLPFGKFHRPAHGFASWAPFIHFHNGLFCVYFRTPGVWIGVKEGLFSLIPSLLPSSGYAGFDWFHVN